MSIRKLHLAFQFCVFVVLTSLCAGNSAAQNSVDINQKFISEQLIEDVDFYIKTIEETHINPYVYISRKDWLARTDNIKSRIAKQGAMTQREFWLLFAPLVSAIQDKHTFIVHPRFFLTNNSTTTKYFPVRTVYLDGKLVVTRSVADEEIQKGAIITSINGIESKKAIRILSDYGYGVEKERLEYVAENLYTDAAEVFGLPKSFALTFSDGTKVQVKGLTLTEMFKREKELEAKDNSQKTEESPLELKFLPNNVAYLKASDFEYDLEKYKILLKNVFTQIQSSGARKLIIDVRENRGGNSVLGDALLDMFNSKPHKHFSMKWKKSVQYVERLKDLNAPIPDHYQKLKPGEVYVSKPGIVKPGANPLRFSGQVYVLSGRKTFSSGQMFLAVVKDNKLATIIGEETNEPGCRAGEVHMFSLPTSRLRVSSSVKYWMPPGGCNGARGIIPDVVITERPNDYLTEKDIILETTLNLIKQRQ
jgi:hypothetical protein